MARWALELEYDGSALMGWQVQPGQPTVQGELVKALSTFCAEPVQVTASGRTDAGVHARAQVASFVTTKERSAHALVRGLNALLPPAISVTRAWPVPDAFDPRRWVLRKSYRYRWLDRPGRSALREGRVWHQPRPLDVEAMDGAARLLEGQHDFTSFRASGCQAAHPVRVVESCQVCRRDDEVHLDIVGNGFLRHMVRIVAGNLTEVGLGRRDAAWLQGVLEARDRTVGARTAPPGGLTLWSVTYGDGPHPWRMR